MKALKRPKTCVSVCLCVKLIPLQYTATSGGRDGCLSIRGTVALVEVGTANVVYGGRGEVLRWIFRPAKLLLGFAVDLDWIKHGDTSWVDGGSNFMAKKNKQNNASQSKFLKQLQIGCNPCQHAYWRWTVSCRPAGPLLWWRESRTSVLSSGLSAWCGQTPPRTKEPSRWPACPPAHACPSSPSSCCCWPLPRWSHRAAMEGNRFVWGKLTHWQEVSLYIASCIGFD